MILTHNRFTETKWNVTEVTQSKNSMLKAFDEIPATGELDVGMKPTSITVASRSAQHPSRCRELLRTILELELSIFACFLFKTGHLTLIKCPPDSHRSSRLVSFLYTLLWEGKTHNLLESKDESHISSELKIRGIGSIIIILLTSINQSIFCFLVSILGK